MQQHQVKKKVQEIPHVDKAIGEPYHVSQSAVHNILDWKY